MEWIRPLFMNRNFKYMYVSQMNKIYYYKCWLICFELKTVSHLISRVRHIVRSCTSLRRWLQRCIFVQFFRQTGTPSRKRPFWNILCTFPESTCREGPESSSNSNMKTRWDTSAKLENVATGAVALLSMKVFLYNQELSSIVNVTVKH